MMDMEILIKKHVDDSKLSLIPGLPKRQERMNQELKEGRALLNAQFKAIAGEGVVSKMKRNIRLRRAWQAVKGNGNGYKSLCGS